MPCQDQTEELELLLDGLDQVEAFSLQKVTCGRTVGEQVLAPYITGRPVDEVLSSSIEQLIPDLDERRRIDSFLLYKQYFSIRAALLVLVGERSGEPDEPFVVEELWFDEDRTFMKGVVSVDLISEEIKSCGSCKSCRTIPAAPLA